jgi:CMP-N,N'-diacetyllegionaminic acid synthase
VRRAVAPASEVLAVVPARAGSKGVPRKNVALLGGYPLIAYSIAAALQARNIDRVIVSTDTREIADIAQRFGAEVPFLRPPELSHDSAPDRGFVLHLLEWLAETEGRVPELLVHLRPTTPLRNSGVIDDAIAMMRRSAQATSLRSVHELSEPPEKMFRLEGPYLVGATASDSRSEYHNLPRQAFAPAFHANGYVDVLRTSFVLDSDGLHGSRMLGFVTPVTVEVDRPEDLEYLAFQVSRVKHPLQAYLESRSSGSQQARLVGE